MIDLKQVTGPIQHLFQDKKKPEGSSDSFSIGSAIGWNSGYRQAIADILELLEAYSVTSKGDRS